MVTRVSGAILAGGTSRRMGTDKAALRLGGATLLERTAVTLSGLTDDLLVVCGRHQPEPAALPGTPWRVVHDRLAARGPMAGLEAALTAAEHEVVLVVAVDMPWLDAGLLGEQLAEVTRDPRLDAVTIAGPRGPEPLHAVYRRRVAPLVTALLNRGEFRLHALLDRLDRVRVMAGPATAGAGSRWSATNINSPREWERVLVASGEPAAQP